MKELIKRHIDEPEKLEQLYRQDTNSFTAAFAEIYPELGNTPLSLFWKIRLSYSKFPEKIRRITLVDIIVLVSSCLFTGFLIKIPAIFNIAGEENFYGKNAALIVFFGLTIYAAWINKVTEMKRLMPVLAGFLILTVYINLLPPIEGSDTITLVCLHLPLLLWSIFGIVFIDFDLAENAKRIDFIRYNGDLAIFMAIMVIAGGILTGITIGLFEAIGINIEKFYFQNVVVIGAVSVPIVATYIIRYYSVLSNKIAPVIAGIFSPLVLLTAVVFLGALAISGKNPYKDRDFLIIFNAMLVGVMAVIVFSISGTSTTKRQKFSEMILFILSIITVVIDVIALSAIFYRLGTFGITPNRMAVLGSNIVILVNLILIIVDLYKVNFRNSSIREVELTVAKYLPVYIAWILIVIFAFPMIFGLK